MTDLLNSTAGSLLWAQSSFQEMSNHFRGERARWGIDDYVVAALLVAAVAIAVWILSRQAALLERRRHTNSPRALFRQLCRAHGLKFGNRRLLWQLARYHRLEHPARLFVEPDRFERSTLSPRLSKRAATIEALRATLFAEPAGADAMSTLAGYATGIDLPAAT